MRMKDKSLRAYSKFIKTNLTLRVFGTATFELMLLAQGKIDICLSFNENAPWDNAAAYVIVKEAGIIIKNIGKRIIITTMDKTKTDAISLFFRYFRILM